MTLFQQKFPSGKVLKPVTYLPIQTDARPNIVLIGSSDKFLTAFFDSNNVKPNMVKTVFAPVILRVPGRAKTAPNNGSIEAHANRENGHTRTVLSVMKTNAEGVVFDMSNHIRLLDNQLGDIPSSSRHEIIQKAVKELTPTLPTKNGMQIFFVEVPLEKEKALKTRIASFAQMDGSLDHIIYDIVEGDFSIFGDLDKNVVLLVNSNFSTIMRIDPRDKRTATRQQRLSAIVHAESMMVAIAAGQKVSFDSEDGTVIATVPEKPVSAPQQASDSTVPADQTEVPLMDIDAVMNQLQADRPVAKPLTAAERRAVEKQIQARNELLKAQETTAKFVTRDGKEITFQELKKPQSTPLISPKKANGRYLDERIASPVFDAVSSTYLESGLYDRDMASVFSSLSKDPLVPHYIQKVERRNTSDSLNIKETVTVQYKDEKGRSTTIHVDLPILTRDTYMVLNGNKYSITKQIMAMPIIKVRPNEVLITTAYNKATVERFGQNASAASSYIRLLAGRAWRESLPSVKVELGVATSANMKHRSTVEYDDVARTVRSIATADSAFIFSRPALSSELKKKAPWFDESKIVDGHPVGYTANGDKVIGLSSSGRVVMYAKGKSGTVTGTDEINLSSLIYAVVSKAAGEKSTLFPKPTTIQRKYMYSRVKMLSQYMPTAVIVGYNIGITEMLKRANVKFELLLGEKARSSLNGERDTISFKDCTIVYDANSLKSSILLNGLKDVDTDDMNIADFGAAGQGWVEYIADRLGGPGHAKALVNYQTSFIDGMTQDLLQEQGLPTDMAGVLIYASDMLDNNEHADPNSMESYRLRGPELINALLYKTLHREMERVRATRESASPQKLMVNQSDVIRAIQGASNVEEVSELNPLLEAELRGKATWTGAAGGLGDGRTVNRAMRAYHKSMHGIFGYYSPDSSEIGVKRSLAFNTAVKDARGRFDLDTKRETASQVFALGELITPFVSCHADAPRIGMQSKQATHTMPILKHTPQLIGSGAEKSLAIAIGNTFAYKAKSDGKVEAIDEVAQLIRLKYDDGSIAYIDMSSRNVKNSGGGFYITTQLTKNPGIKVGARFKKNDVLAHDPLYFAPMDDGSTAYKSGLLTRVAITPLDQTYEDSLMITHKLMKDTISLVTMQRAVSFGAKANIQSIAKVGDVVSPNSNLAVFENVSDDGDISALLQRVGQEFESAIADQTRNTASAKYSGKIVEIRTYYNRDPSDLSVSLQKFIAGQEKLADERKRAAAGAPADEPVRVNAPIRINRDKVGGETVNGVLVVFLIQIEDMAAPGDKYVTSSPLKGIVSRVLEEGEEPFDESGKQVDYVISPLSIISRMTEDAFLALWTQSVIVDLKSAVLDIYDEA